MWITGHDGGVCAWPVQPIVHAIAAGPSRTACSLRLHSCSGRAATLNPRMHSRKPAFSPPPQTLAEALRVPTPRSRRVVIHDGGWSFLGLVAAQMGRCDAQTGAPNLKHSFKKKKMHHAPTVSLWETQCKMVPTKMPALPPLHPPPSPDPSACYIHVYAK